MSRSSSIAPYPAPYDRTARRLEWAFLPPGLRDRLAMLDGRLQIDSPAGRPTVATVVVPPGAEQ